MNRSTRVESYFIGDSVIVKINDKLNEGKILHKLGDDLYLFETTTKDTRVISLAQIIHKVYTEDSLVIKIPKGTECIIDTYFVGEDKYLVSLHKITDKAD